MSGTAAHYPATGNIANTIKRERLTSPPPQDQTKDYLIDEDSRLKTILLFSGTAPPNPPTPQGLLVELGRVCVFDLLPLVVARSGQPLYRGERGNDVGAAGLPGDVWEILPPGVGRNLRSPAGACVVVVVVCCCHHIKYHSDLSQCFRLSVLTQHLRHGVPTSIRSDRLGDERSTVERPCCCCVFHESKKRNRPVPTKHSLLITSVCVPGELSRAKGHFVIFAPSSKRHTSYYMYDNFIASPASWKGPSPASRFFVCFSSSFFFRLASSSLCARVK